MDPVTLGMARANDSLDLAYAECASAPAGTTVDIFSAATSALTTVPGTAVRFVLPRRMRVNVRLSINSLRNSNGTTQGVGCRVIEHPSLTEILRQFAKNLPASADVPVSIDRTMFLAAGTYRWQVYYGSWSGGTASMQIGATQPATLRVTGWPA